MHMELRVLIKEGELNGRGEEREERRGEENFFDVGSSKSDNRGNCGGIRVKRQKGFTKDKKSN